ncbi:S-adenosyl-L-methionine-dependent methyltransferase [Zopfia rhizophila CBS 207.26]|uniref:S-adenosyl-L-methionine-dependent methyltransferase n=1 Tax=Zopfia rhizophila CBS 207.26 TaxID=1314779 RepID=A0A6A6DE47_9PEZI|nr:S-adenosyl-L-methionine-dependent methyltransferase [Zopfia rhizophila CBS 207.26]
MEEEPPQPDNPARDHTAAQHKRARADSETSTSVESIHSTRTLQSEDLEFVQENDRIYANQTYFIPCDQTEQDRLTIQHQVYVYALKGKLTTTKITPSTRRILDLGTGPGNWAVAIAQQYPHAEVVGIDMAVWDLETTEGETGSGRVTWEIDDLDVWGVEPDIDELTSRLEHYDPFRDPAARHLTDSSSRFKGKEPQTQSHSSSVTELSFDPYILKPEAQPGWHFSQPFDFIHARCLSGAFAHWEDVYAEIYKNLMPGGWVEIAAYELVLPEMENSTSEPDEFPFQSLRRLYRAMMTASFKSGRPLGTFYMHPTYLEDAGFKDVRTTYVNVPVGTWPEDEEQKKIGKMFLVVFMESLEPFCLRLLTKYGDAERIWTAEEVREVVEKAKNEILEWDARIEGVRRKEGWCANFKWVVGRKSKNA